MGLFARDPADARDRHRTRRLDDRGQTPPVHGPRRRGPARLWLGLLCSLCLGLIAHTGSAETFRIATYNTELGRKGPGLLLRDLQANKDPQIAAVLQIITHAHPDILLLQGVDHDPQGRALNAFSERLADLGVWYPHTFALPPNAGQRLGANAVQSYGPFTGAGGMALLSRYPILTEAVQDFSSLIWADQPWATLPAGLPHARQQRLSNMGHWAVPIALPDGTQFSLLALHASPPVFDGPEDTNGLRNGDELRLWQHVLDGLYGVPPRRFVILGDLNNDPTRGEGLKRPLNELLTDPRLQFLPPKGAQGAATVDWSAIGLGPMQVSYILPDRDWQVTDAGVLWPDADHPMAQAAETASRHRLVWMDLSLPTAPLETAAKTASLPQNSTKVP